VALGTANSRMKDFYDLLALARLFTHDGRSIAAAIRATFDRRSTHVPFERPAGLGTAFAADQQKEAMWRAFINREPLLVETGSLETTVEEIAAFVMQPALAAHAGRLCDDVGAARPMATDRLKWLARDPSSLSSRAKRAPLSCRGPDGRRRELKGSSLWMTS
jgi:hypothetical protein